MICFSVKFRRNKKQALGLGVPYPQFGTPERNVWPLGFDDISPPGWIFRVFPFWESGTFRYDGEWLLLKLPENPTDHQGTPPITLQLTLHLWTLNKSGRWVKSKDEFLFAVPLVFWECQHWTMLGFQGSCAPPTHAAKTPFKRNLVRQAADRVKGTSKKRVGLERWFSYWSWVPCHFWGVYGISLPWEAAMQGSTDEECCETKFCSAWTCSDATKWVPCRTSGSTFAKAWHFGSISTRIMIEPCIFWMFRMCWMFLCD